MNQQHYFLIPFRYTFLQKFHIGRLYLEMFFHLKKYLPQFICKFWLFFHLLFV